MYYGWVVLGVAALAMVGTLPGRTQGLGLITESLLRDFSIDRVRMAEINLVAAVLSWDVPYRFRFGVAHPVTRAVDAPAVSSYFAVGLAF